MIAFSIGVLSACQTGIPKDALELSPTSLEDRGIQTRYFDSNNEADTLSACAAVLQDLGFNLEESETKLGYILGSKDRDATDSGQVVLAVILALLGGGAMAIDENQKLRASIIVSPDKDGTRMKVRATFQRKVWNTQGNVSNVETIMDPETYQEFFSLVSKSIFLEEQKI